MPKIKKFIRIGNNPTVYGITGTKVQYKRVFPDRETFFACGGKWKDVISVTEAEAAEYKDGKPIKSVK